MDRRARVLVVEDIATLRESYVANLELEGEFRVDAARDLQSATDALERCAYHVAIVDIMLAGEKDVANRDGVHVLRRLQMLDEGTSALVLTAQEHPQLARDILKRYGAFDYLAKAVLQKDGMPALLEKVRSGVKESSAGAVSWESAIDLLRGPRSEDELVADVMHRLQFKGGFENLNRTLVAALAHVAPLVPRRGNADGLTFDERDQVYRGTFWSKGQAASIELAIGGKDSSMATEDATTLLERDKAGLHVRLLKADGLERPAFEPTPATAG